MSIEDLMLPCLSKVLFGMECMGCGIQRSVVLLLKGEFAAAFIMYPAIYTLIFLLGFIGLNHFKNIKFANAIIITLAIINLILILGNYILKLI